MSHARAWLYACSKAPHHAPPLHKDCHTSIHNCHVRLCLALRLFEKSSNDVTTSTISNQLLHVCRAGGTACYSKKKPVLICEPPHTWTREKACSSKIKLLLIVRVDATHHSTGPTWLPLNLAERPVVYNTPFAATSNIYPTTN